MNKKKAIAAGVPVDVLKLTRAYRVFVALDENGKFVDYGFDRGYARRFSKTVRKLENYLWESA